MNWRIRSGVPPYTPSGWEVTNGSESYWFQTEDWAEFFRKHCERLDNAVKPQPTYTSVLGESHSIDASRPQLSEWTCHLFGSNGNGISWIPPKGQVPNWFWRKMQGLILGFKWEQRGRA